MFFIIATHDLFLFGRARSTRELDSSEDSETLLDVDEIAESGSSKEATQLGGGVKNPDCSAPTTPVVSPQTLESMCDVSSIGARVSLDKGSEEDKVSLGVYCQEKEQSESSNLILTSSTTMSGCIDEKMRNIQDCILPNKFAGKTLQEKHYKINIVSQSCKLV